jgi:hypothetical protein
MSEIATTIQYRLYISRRRAAKTASRHSQPLEPQIPRISRLMAVALLLEEKLRERADLKYADLARLGSVEPSRISQIMNMLYLAPDIQEQLLFLPSSNGRDLVCERHIRSLAIEYDWGLQRQAFALLLAPTLSKATPTKRAPHKHEPGIVEPGPVFPRRQMATADQCRIA